MGSTKKIATFYVHQRVQFNQCFSNLAVLKRNQTSMYFTANGATTDICPGFLLILLQEYKKEKAAARDKISSQNDDVTDVVRSE